MEKHFDDNVMPSGNDFLSRLDRRLWSLQRHIFNTNKVFTVFKYYPAETRLEATERALLIWFIPEGQEHIIYTWLKSELEQFKTKVRIGYPEGNEIVNPGADIEIRVMYHLDTYVMAEYAEMDIQHEKNTIKQMAITGKYQNAIDKNPATKELMAHQMGYRNRYIVGFISSKELFNPSIKNDFIYGDLIELADPDGEELPEYYQFAGFHVKADNSTEAEKIIEDHLRAVDNNIDICRVIEI